VAGEADRDVIAERPRLAFVAELGALFSLTLDVLEHQRAFP
jgi:hypothetical protein